jgi:carbamoyltransferase
MDLAASVQAVLEEAVLWMTSALVVETGKRNLCLAGGVALNCVTNGKILRDGRFDRIWIQPAAGGAVGAALCGYHRFKQQTRPLNGQLDAMSVAGVAQHRRRSITPTQQSCSTLTRSTSRAQTFLP